MRKAGWILVAVIATMLLSTTVGHAKRAWWRPHHAATPAQKAAPVIPTDKAALVIANSRYPDADAPLTQIAGNADALASALRDRGYQVEVVTNATGTEAMRAAERLKARVRRGGSVVVYLGGFGVQSRGQNYLIPVDAAIWQERDVRTQGINVNSLLAVIRSTGARTSLAYIDASLRNPYERRFRTYSHGLAPIGSDAATPVVTSAAPGQVLENTDRSQSAAMAKLVKRLRSSQPVDQVFKDVQTDLREAMY
ncbi:caspase domain-containing protein [Bradyrhizobium sp. STM 3557]|uniref:caspase family protein n=1 Tax=Bradyrhizobium sp. STM 3557 TaxID=578920 RepID=UPI00388F9E67